MSTQFSNWWKYYPKVPAPDSHVFEPPPDLQPAFQIGDVVRLRGKPDRLREVLAIEWHFYRGEFAYIVETSAAHRFVWARPHSPYWFAPQLQLEGHNEVELQVKTHKYQRKKGIRLVYEEVVEAEVN
jgi:hypothetical protein